MSLRELKPVFEQTDFLENIDQPFEPIKLEGNRSLSQVFGEDFLPTILFFRNKYIHSNVILGDDAISWILDQAEEYGNFYEQGEIYSQVPEHIKLLFTTIFFRDTLAVTNFTLKHLYVLVAHTPYTED